MRRSIRQVVESPLDQGVDEEINYQLTTTPYGSTPIAVAVMAYDVTNNAYSDVTATVLSGEVYVLGDVITLPTLSSLTAGKSYRIEIKFSTGGQVYEPYLIVKATT